MIRNLSKNKISILCWIIAVVILLISIITLCVFDDYSKGLAQSKITLYVDGTEYNRTAEIENNTSYEIKVDSQKGVNYYIHVDAQYGCIDNNSVLKINDNLASLTRIPLRVTLIKDNYAVSEYVYYFIIGEDN